jgi:hypothetical protein
MRTYPRSVRQQLIQKSGPHPDIMRTPTGGTTFQLVLVHYKKRKSVVCSRKMVIRTKKTAEPTPISTDLIGIEID